MQLHKHSPQQQELLEQLLIAVTQDLLSFVFSDPVKDEANIRAHAALSGKRELLLQLCADNYPEPDPLPEVGSDPLQTSF